MTAPIKNLSDLKEQLNEEQREIKRRQERVKVLQAWHKGLAGFVEAFDAEARGIEGTWRCIEAERKALSQTSTPARKDLVAEVQGVLDGIRAAEKAKQSEIKARGIKRDSAKKKLENRTREYAQLTDFKALKGMLDAVRKLLSELPSTEKERQYIFSLRAQPLLESLEKPIQELSKLKSKDDYEKRLIKALNQIEDAQSDLDAAEVAVAQARVALEQVHRDRDELAEKFTAELAKRYLAPEAKPKGKHKAKR